MRASPRPSENCVFSKTRSVSVKENRGEEERQREESQTERAPAQGRVYSGRGKELKAQCNPTFACTKLCAFS